METRTHHNPQYYRSTKMMQGIMDSEAVTYKTQDPQERNLDMPRHHFELLPTKLKRQQCICPNLNVLPNSWVELRDSILCPTSPLPPVFSLTSVRRPCSYATFLTFSILKPLIGMSREALEKVKNQTWYSLVISPFVSNENWDELNIWHVNYHSAEAL